MPSKKIYNSIAALTTCGVKTAADQMGVAKLCVG